MATSENKKFQLNKSKDHQFDISKKGKRIFDLKKDDDAKEADGNKPQVTPVKSTQVNTPQPTSSPASTPEVNTAPKGGSISSEDNESTSGKKWIWMLLIGLGVILGIWWLLGPSKSNDSADDTPTEVLAVIDSVEVPASEIPSSVTSNEANEEIENQSREEIAQKSEGNHINTNSSDLANKESGQIENPVPSTQTSTASEPAKASLEATSKASSATVSVSDDIQAEALKVIKGEYGDGSKRKALLGSRYQEIQNRVNELKRQGFF